MQTLRTYRIYLLVSIVACTFFLVSARKGCLFAHRQSGNKTATLPDSLKVRGRGKNMQHMVLSPPDSIGPLHFSAQFDSALLQNTLYLVRPSTDNKPISGIKKEDLIATNNALQSWKEITPALLYETFDFYRIQTEYQAEKVRITGYYTPVISVSHKQTAKYNIPIMRKPDSWQGKVPTRDEILNGALAGKKLEIAWCRQLSELTNAQLQGSCMIEYPDGTQRFLGFGGTNKNLSNEHLNQPDQKAYVFFQERGENAWGAAGFPLNAQYSIAIDQQVIPLGACLLARIPVRDHNGVTRQVHRIVMAQDVGGSIKTSGHIDLYCGVGKQGLDRVRAINGLAKLWLLLPKKKPNTPKKK